MNNSKSIIVTTALALVVVAVSCSSSPTVYESASTDDDRQDSAEEDAEPSPTDDAGPRFGTFGFDFDGMDPDTEPGNDFYAFANGTWEETEEIPDDLSSYGVFDKLRLEAEQDVHELIVAVKKQDAEPGSNEQRVGDFYRSWMNEDAINDAGLEPAEPYLDDIAEIEDHDDAARLMADIDFPSLYGVGILPDPADPTVYAVRAGQSGLGMPDRDYYLNDSPRFEEYRQAYRDYIVDIHDLAGIGHAEVKADAIIDFETKLADIHWSRERSRDITETYNVVDIDEFAQMAPSLGLLEGLEIRGIEELDEIIVSQPSAIEATGELFADTTVATIRDYLTFHFLSDRAPWLGNDFDRAHFQFYSQTLRGTEEQRDRYRRGVRLVDRHLGHAIGPKYVEHHFPPEAREQMDELVDNLLASFRQRLETLEWMDDETRREALDKLSTFEARIGYPEVWESFEDLEIRDDDYFGNRMRIAEHDWNDQIERLSEPVDRRRWHWPPQTVNASYSPLMNQITFPAGILQAPFFDPDADPAINFGAIGGVIGHEIGHGFDDQGRRYDKKGRIRDWWTDETDQRFEKASGDLVEQYEEFCPFDDQCVNGRLSLGENIGDLGGLQMAYMAYQNYVEATYPDGQAPVIDGVTGDQRFFLAWAQVWRTLYRDDALRSRLVSGPHAPARYRVNGVVRNLAPWYEAFDVDDDHDLYIAPDDRVTIW